MVIDLFQKSPILHKGHVISKHNEKSLFLGQLLQTFANSFKTGI